MTRGGPRRQRARLWADLYAAIFGTDEADHREESDAESEAGTEAARER
jgi:hypothetical protein